MRNPSGTPSRSSSRNNSTKCMPRARARKPCSSSGATASRSCCATSGCPAPAASTSYRRPSRSSPRDRKSTRLNSCHLVISYADFCLKKKNNHLVAELSPHAAVDLVVLVSLASSEEHTSELQLPSNFVCHLLLIHIHTHCSTSLNYSS